MSCCAAEMCANWTGDGCICEVMGIERAVVCEHGGLAANCLACEEQSWGWDE